MIATFGAALLPDWTGDALDFTLGERDGLAEALGLAPVERFAPASFSTSPDADGLTRLEALAEYLESQARTARDLETSCAFIVALMDCWRAIEALEPTVSAFFNADAGVSPADNLAAFRKSWFAKHPEEAPARIPVRAKPRGTWTARVMAEHAALERSP